MLAQELSRITKSTVKPGNLALQFETRLSLDEIDAAISELRTNGIDQVKLCVLESAIEGLKFSACLPTEISLEVIGKRFADHRGAKRVLNEIVKYVTVSD